MYAAAKISGLANGQWNWLVWGGRRKEGWGLAEWRVAGWGGCSGEVGLPHYSRSAGVPAAVAPLPTALARPRRRTESRPTSFILPAATEVTRGRSAARIQSPGVTDGVADQPSLKVFHLFFILGKSEKKKKMRPRAYFPRRPPPGRLYGYVRRPWRCCCRLFEFLLRLDETANTALWLPVYCGVVMSQYVGAGVFAGLEGQPPHNRHRNAWFHHDVLKRWGMK